MTDGLGTAGDDLQRPLDESLPVDTAPTRIEPIPRQARPADPVSLEPSATGPTPTEPAPTEPTPTEPAPTEPTPTGPTPTEPSDVPAVEPDGTVPLRTAVPAGTAAPKPGIINLDVAVTAAQVIRHARTWLPVRVARVAGRVLLRAWHQIVAWSRRPTGRFAVPGMVLAALIGLAVATGAYLVPTSGVADQAAPTATPTVPGATLPPGLVVPGAVPTVGPPVGGTVNPTAPPATGGFTGAVGNPTEALTGWAQATAALTGIPMIAQRAYGYAELILASTMPACQLRWTTLAAIGQVESNHGSSGGATLLPDGRALPAITGPALDGTGGTQEIRDSDGGQLDGDTVYDRAVGPMQFIPRTWYLQADPLRGIADVHDIDDAAQAAGYYLCEGGRNLSVADDWWAAILSYNNVQTYANAVFGYANEYGERSRSGTA
jgi:hypothetical protein